MTSHNTRFTDDEIIAALDTNGSIEATARALGINRRSLQRRKKRLALKGHAPEHDMKHTVPDGFSVAGVSTYYDRNGAVIGQWVKSKQDPAQVQAMVEEMIKSFADDLPKVARRKAQGKYLSDIMVGYPIGDAHIGMRAWAEETGDDWDLEIAEKIQCGAMAALVESAPTSETATIVNLGDWFHYDSMIPVTPRSGHHLDSDGRYAKVIRVGIKVMRQCIESALEKHKTVRVVNVIGNHDETGALWLSAALAHIYDREPRVTIETSPSVFTYVEFGKNLVGMHHGHTCKAEKLPAVMAADQPEAWGRTQFRTWWTGHVHHESVKEYPGCTVETFNTLAYKDAYATNGGWRSKESMKAVVLHKEYGEVARFTVNPRMLKGH